MSNIPEKCSRCGAPISWEEGAPVVKCEYCGYKNNFLKIDSIINNKQSSFIYSIKNNSAKYLLITKESFRKAIKNQNIISENLIYKYIKKGKELFKRKESKITLSLIFLSAFFLLINSYLSNPIRTYNKKIKNVCNQSLIESINYGATEFQSKSNYKDCVNYMKDTVLLIKNLEDKSNYLKSYLKSLKKLEEEIYNKSISIDYTQKQYIRFNSSNNIAVVYKHFINSRFVSSSKIIYENNKVFEDVNYLPYKFCRGYKKFYKDSSLNSKNMDLNMPAKRIFKEMTKRQNKFIDQIIKIEGSEILLDLYNQGYFLSERIRKNLKKENYSAYLDNYATLKEMLINQKQNIFFKCEELY